MSNNTPEVPRAKLCSACNTVKPFTEFHRDATKKYGVASTCKECAKARVKRWKSDNPERVIKNRQRLQETKGDELRKIARNYYHANKKRVREYWRNFRQENAAQHRAKAKQWAKNNPEKRREIANRYRARRQNAPISDFTAEQWLWLKEQYGNRCAYCGGVFSDLQVEHVKPLSKGGLHTLSNIVPACAPCNFHKHDKTPEEACMSFAVEVNALEHMEQKPLL